MFYETVYTNFPSGVLNVPCYDVISFIDDLHRALYLKPIFVTRISNYLFRDVTVPLICFLKILDPSPVEMHAKEYTFISFLYLFIQNYHPFIYASLHIVYFVGYLYFISILDFWGLIHFKSNIFSPYFFL